MTAAIFGLLGVIVGGVLNALIAARAERRRDRSEARAMSRLIGRELAGALPGVREWLEAGNATYPSREDVLRFPAWERYHLAAARALPAPDWDAVSAAYLVLYSVRTREEFAAHLGQSARDHLQLAEALMADAITRLGTHADATLLPPAPSASESS
jgi:hypothetical protein